jgi:hypothetical protein
MSEIAGFAAEYQSSGGVICYGYGDTRQMALADAEKQFAGVRGTSLHGIMSRVYTRGLSAGQRSLRDASNALVAMD